MSAIDTSCFTLPPEKESGGGEMSRCKPPPSGSGSAHMIVSEIMSEIVDNAFEVIMAKNLQPPQKVEKITPNVVGDILENILSPTSNTGVSNDNYRHDETALLNDEIKQIIKEMKYPPEPKNIICTQGVGDQLGDKATVAPDKVLPEPVKRNTLERKNRLTNLVRNSKQMVTKFVTPEAENEVRMTKSEEMHEKLLKVIDLEGDDHYMEPGSSSATGILRMPLETTMDMVDLGADVSAEGEGGMDVDAKEGGDDSLSKVESKKAVSSHKKKWNLGSKILKYIKRNKEGKK